MKKLIAGMSLAVAAVSAFAAPAPYASLSTSGASFAEYTGSTVGSNDINTNNTLFWMFEGTKHGLNSYLLMFDPQSNSRMVGSVTFSGNIVGVLSTQQDLIESQIYKKPDVTYDWRTNSGLETRDELEVSGNKLTLDWRGNSPGDNIRVLTTAVPEPETYAMFLAGLGLIGAIVRRKNI